MKREQILRNVLAIAAASFVTSTASADKHQKSADKEAGKHYCANNECKGHSDCGGRGNENGCHGTNECKGKGFKEAKTEKECVAKKGKWTKEG